MSQRMSLSFYEGRRTGDMVVRLTIAHRLATVRRADVIFALDDGVIAERGTHAELLAGGGLYVRLYRLQFEPEAAAS